jgi:hypothetical protein
MIQSLNAQQKVFVWMASIFLLPRLFYWTIFVFFPEHVNIDAMNHYWILSDSFLREGRLELVPGQLTSQIEPLYPLWIAFLRAVTGDSLNRVLLAQILFSAVGYFYFYKLCKKFLPNLRGVYIAALICSFSPFMIRSTLKIIEVSFLRTLLVIATYYTLQASKSNLWKTLKAGLAWGLCLLTRSMIFPAFVIFGVRFFFLKQFRKGFLFLFSAFLLASPMFVYNYKVDGSLFPTRGGLNFFLGNCIYYSRIMPIHHVDNLEAYAHELLAKERPDLVNASEKQQDRFFYQKGFEFIKTYPAKFLRNKALNLTYFFSPSLIPILPLGSSNIQVSEDGSLRIEIMNANFPGRGAFEILAHSFKKGLVIMFGILGFFLRRRNLKEIDFVFLTLFVNFAAVYTLFWPSTRLYSPVMFVFLAYAAYGLAYFIPPAARFWALFPRAQESVAA